MKLLYTLILIGTFGTIPQIWAQESEGVSAQGDFAIISNVEEFILLLNDDLSSPIYYTVGDTIKVPIGEQSFRAVAEGYHDATFNATIYPDRVTGQQINFTKPLNVQPRSSYQTITNGYNVTVYSEEGAEIFINQVLVGYTQVNVLLTEGEQELFINHPEYGTISTKIYATIDESKNVHRYFMDYRSTPKIARFVPGLGYIMDGKKSSALLTISGLATLIYYQGYATAKADRLTDDMNLYIRRNLSSGPIYENRVKQYEADIKQFERRSTVAIIGAGILYAATTYHTFQRPKGGYKTPPVELNMQAFNQFGEVTPQFNLTINF